MVVTVETGMFVGVGVKVKVGGSVGVTVFAGVRVGPGGVVGWVAVGEIGVLVGVGCGICPGAGRFRSALSRTRSQSLLVGAANCRLPVVAKLPPD